MSSNTIHYKSEYKLVSFRTDTVTLEANRKHTETFLSRPTSATTAGRETSFISYWTIFQKVKKTKSITTACNRFWRGLRGLGTGRCFGARNLTHEHSLGGLTHDQFKVHARPR